MPRRRRQWPLLVLVPTVSRTTVGLAVTKVADRYGVSRQSVHTYLSLFHKA
jgi:hypothetical protein